MSKDIIDYINKVIEMKINEINNMKIAYGILLEDLQRKYNFSDEVLLELFKYCTNRNCFHVNYIQAVADYWRLENIRTMEDLKRLKILK